MSADDLHSNSKETLHQPDGTGLLKAKEFQEVTTTQQESKDTKLRNNPLVSLKP